MALGQTWRSWISLLLTLKPSKPINFSTISPALRQNPIPIFHRFHSSILGSPKTLNFDTKEVGFPSLNFGVVGVRFSSYERVVQELLAEVEREKQREREEKKRAGEPVNDEDEEEDYMGVGKLIEKLEGEKVNETDLMRYEEYTDSDSDEDERPSAEEMKKRVDLFEKKFKRHQELVKNFVSAETLDDAFMWMNKIDKFEKKYLKLRLEYRVIGELMNRLKESTGKERFILIQKINRAIRLMQWKVSFDPNNPANYGVIKHEQGPSEEGPSDDLLVASFDKQKQMLQGDDEEEDEHDFNESKDKDEIFAEKLNAIDKKLEEKLQELERTFGKKGRALEEEIRDLAQERNSLLEKKRKPLYRKGFDVRLIDINRTCKVTKGGQIISYTALLVCGNYHGVISFAKAKAPAVPIAFQKAYEKCFQNLHYVERYEEHTIAHAVQTKYKQTKIYLWPAPTTTGMKASRTVETILHLAGFKNVKSKVIGSRNPYNTVKALFKALNAVETPKDVQEKFGRVVVESYLL
ncbi:hypothetical protein AMTRI_Chr07g25540 [Amborella trichopoda]|uniref:S5 DRBM domain-containing protein n=1 Tax=Amborella trichopoda TaxID=13333 RepID=U5CRN3_AMBTC|nr:uncharacterized protein LOC18444175 [Amborella trichopoda]XP_020529236.1 uncharacterized protein LOC18444175 [Amborella trichopoda]XP_020529237.1 uncharacterized protein LOC18444175 [Amborella trichopoda]ERN15881.1 hypothetical protein AMTR_s00039p00202100 [Amborella trichopoda]|eukprot:XP_006854414.1 uncharacterized protein LOC18444175 [Amborella trichopoda]